MYDISCESSKMPTNNFVLDEWEREIHRLII